MVDNNAKIKNVITIDSGTTNTRVCLWIDNEFQERLDYSQGVQKSILDKNNISLKLNIKNAVDELKSKYNILDNETIVVASGMITSKNGLKEIEHIESPVGISELSKSMEMAMFPEICSIPIWFIPGVKSKIVVDKDEIFPKYDIMRGEETEIMYVQSLVGSNGVIVMPGSHTKFVRMNNCGEIVASRTTITGEILSLITTQSIISDHVNSKFCEKIEPFFLLNGYKSAKKNGIGSAIFEVRLLDQECFMTRNELANYLLGAILSLDVQMLESFLNENEKIILTGKSQLREGLKIILYSIESFEHKIYEIEEKNLAAYGALMIATEKGLVGRGDCINED